jgi:hypothetical protein
MPKLPSNFNWKESPTHMELLNVFAKPHDVSHILTWQTIRQTLGESTEDAVERFVRDGVLVTATLEESLIAVFQVTELKKLLKERDIKQSGSKSELAEKLVEADRTGAEKLLKKHRVMKCSESALTLLSERKSTQAQELESAQSKSFEFLKNGKPKDAYKSYAEYHKKYSTVPYKNGSYAVHELQFILVSSPKVLGVLSQENLKLVRAAAGMSSLWGDQKPEYWLPENFSTPIRDNKRAINYLLRNAQFNEHLTGASKYTKKLKIVFENSDVDSCPLCMKLNGKVFDVDNVPELPMMGCTSEKGCMCNFEDFFEDNDTADEIEFTEEELDELEGLETNPVKRLRFVKQMLDEGLITRQEFDAKKKEILDKT